MFLNVCSRALDLQCLQDMISYKSNSCFWMQSNWVQTVHTSLQRPSKTTRKTETPVIRAVHTVLITVTTIQTSWNGEVLFLFICLYLSQLFSDVAYKARDREDLIAGIDEFLDEVIVLPPGEWDPKIRIEPPKKVTSADKRLEKSAYIYLLLFLCTPTTIMWSWTRTW